MSKSLTVYKRFFWIMGVLCLGAIVLNLAVRRGPVNDATAVDDLRTISSVIDNYYSSNMSLPGSLADIKSNLSAAARQRLSKYEYVASSNSRYQLCATFATAGSSGITTMPYPVSGNPDPALHGKGHQCFNYIVNNFGVPKPL